MKASEKAKYQREVKAYFARIYDVPQCEICGTTEPPIDFAHARKRRYVLTREDYHDVAMLCRFHHLDLEHGGHDRMYEEIMRIKANREG